MIGLALTAASQASMGAAFRVGQDEHGASTAAHARGHVDAAGDRLLAAARSAAAFWVGLHVRAFSP